MSNYGHPGMRGDGSIRFTGVHKAGIMNNRTRLNLHVVGYDFSSQKFTEDADDILIGLYSDGEGHLVSGWSFHKLFENWNKKHSEAMYIEYEKRETEYKKEIHDFDYKYTGRVFYGTGTSINNFFNGVSKGIAYDPAHSIYKDGKSKQGLNGG